MTELRQRERPVEQRPDIDRFYRPRSIAVVGAHDSRPGLAGTTQKAMEHAQLVDAEFLPVNPTRESVFGVPCLPSLTTASGPIDVVVVQVGDPAAIVEEAAAAGVEMGFVLVFSNGFAETGTTEGRERERRLVEACHAADTRLIGPNTNANAWDPVLDNAGRKIAVVSQSGVQGRPLTQAQQLGIALSRWAPTGNEADLEAADFLSAFAADPDTAVIAAYIEGFASGAGLRRAAVDALEHQTPIVLVKVGRSEVGGSMAQSHTGHLVGSDAAYDAFFDQFGIVRVDDMDQLVEVAAALARCPVPTADGIAVCSPSGGTAAHVADLVSVAGLDLPSLSAQVQDGLRALVPPSLRVDNPVDNGGSVMIADPATGPRILELSLQDDAVGLVLCPIPASAPLLTEATVRALVDYAPRATKPVLPIWPGPTVRHPAYQQLWDAGLPVFGNVRTAVLAAKALIGHPGRSGRLARMARVARELGPVPLPAGPACMLDERESTAWLSARGLPFAQHLAAVGAADAAAAAVEIGFPVVLKGTGVSHKSEHGLVVTGLTDAGAVRAAAERLLAAGAAGLLVAEQVRGGVELLVGVSTDAVLGPVIVVGAGGVAAEVHRDVSRSVLPLTRERARDMLSELRIAPLLYGWRGAPSVDREAVVDVLVRVAEIAASGEIVELDVNPLLARPEGAVGLDALVGLAP